MSLPAWMGVSPVNVPLRDSPYKAGWRATGVHYSAIPDPCLPPEPGVLEAIQEFYPEAQYVREVKVYKSPSQRVHTFTRHAVASCIMIPKTKKPPFRITLPEAYEYPRPNMLDFVVQHGWYTGGNSVLPGGYAQWSWELVPYLRHIFDRRSDRERKALYIHKVLAKQAREEEAAAKEWQGQLDAEAKYWEKRLNEISDVELAQYVRQLAAIRADRQRQYMEAVVRAREAAPKSVYLGSGRKDH